MIPDTPEELHVLAGEYVLGVLEPDAAREVAGALAQNAALSRAVRFWEERLHPLSGLASPAEPPAGMWQRIESGIDGAAKPGWWNALWLWRAVAVAATAVAACLALYIAFAPPAAGPSYVAVLHAPQGQQPAFVATASPRGLLVHAVASETAPSDRGFELWAIPPGAKPISLGMMRDDGRLELGTLPPAISPGTTLAITLEPKTGAPHPAPSSAPVFLGTLVPAK